MHFRRRRTRQQTRTPPVDRRVPPDELREDLPELRRTDTEFAVVVEHTLPQRPRRTKKPWRLLIYEGRRWFWRYLRRGRSSGRWVCLSRYRSREAAESALRAFQKNRLIRSEDRARIVGPGEQDVDEAAEERRPD